MQVSKNIPAYDFLRGLAIFLVFCAHILTLHPDWKSYGWVSDVFSLGGTGVQLFFVVSALTLYRSFQLKKGADTYKTFMLRRFFRIYPMYLVALLISFLLIRSEPGIGFSTASLLSHFSLFHGFFVDHANSLIGVEWSLTTEFFFYSWALFFFVRAENPDFLKKFAIGSMILAFLFHGWKYHYNPVFHLFSFPLAILLSPRVEKLSQKTILSVIICLTVFFVATALNPTLREILRSPPLLWVAFYTFLVIYIRDFFYSAEDGFWNRRIQGLFEQLGLISYSFYFIHIVLIVLLRPHTHQLIENGLNSWAMLGLGFASLFVITFGLSYVTYRWIELPAMAYGKKKIQTVNSRTEKV